MPTGEGTDGVAHLAASGDSPFPSSVVLCFPVVVYPATYLLDWYRHPAVSTILYPTDLPTHPPTHPPASAFLFIHLSISLPSNLPFYLPCTLPPPCSDTLHLHTSIVLQYPKLVSPQCPPDSFLLSHICHGLSGAAAAAAVAVGCLPCTWNVLRGANIVRLGACVSQEGMSVEALKTFTTKVCSFPSFFNQTLHEKILNESGVVPGSGLVKASDASAWWSKWCENKCPGERLWALLRGPNSDSVTRDDWKKNLASLLDTHPGLDFLKSTPEFQASPLLSQPRANEATLFRV